MTTTWFSLRRRLLGLLLGGVAAAWLVTMVFSYVDAHHEVDELFDAQLAQAAQTLLALASHDEGEGVEDLGEAAHKYQRRLRFQIWRADGKLLMRSNNAPESPLTGEFDDPEEEADIDAVMREIKAALADEARRQALLNAEDEPKGEEPPPPWAQ